MDDHQLQQVAWAMQQLLSELSTLLPNEPALAEKLADFLRQLQQEPESVALVEARIHCPLSRFPVAQQRWLSLLQAGAEEQSAVLRDIYTEGGSVVGGDAHVGGDFVGRDKITNHYHGVNTAVTRYSDILIPSRVAVAQRFAIIVGLTCQPNADSRDVQPLQATAGQSVQVMLTPFDTLEVLGARLKPVIVLAERDSEPAVFYLRSKQPGEQRLRIDFWSEGQLVASSDQSIRAVDENEIVTVNQIAMQPLLLEEPRVLYPDLVMRVSTVDNRLRFDLHYGDIQFKHFEGERLRSDPQHFRHELLQEIEGLLGETGNEDVNVDEELSKIGQRLYRELWPLELRREYRRFHQQVRTFVIFSDEPWIPWELIKPYDDEEVEQVVEDDFLCLQFDFTRWVTPATQPAQLFPIQSLAIVSPRGTNLAAVNDEAELLHHWATAQGWQDCTPPSVTERDVETLLRSDQAVHLWHFACHGKFDETQPGRSPLILEEGTQLIPDDLVGKAATRLRKDRPFVFLNACEVGSAGLSLTGLSGWAKTLVQDCGVGAFLAPMWMVEDEYAQQFAQAFYQKVQQPQVSIAQAVRHARCELKKQALNSPVWLAYSLYGHPNAMIGMTSPTTK